MRKPHQSLQRHCNLTSFVQALLTSVQALLCDIKDHGSHAQPADFSLQHMGAFVAEVNQHQGIYQKLKTTLEEWEAAAAAGAAAGGQWQPALTTSSSHHYGFTASSVLSSGNKVQPVGM
jgi:formylglycine-generating enzyme required for sulfatase activity